MTEKPREYYSEYYDDERKLITKAALEDFKHIRCPVDGAHMRAEIVVWRALETNDIVSGIDDGTGRDVWQISVKCTDCGRSTSSINLTRSGGM